MEEITHLLVSAHKGDKQAFDKVYPLVYDQLRIMAHRIRIRQNPNQTLNTTSLVHEAYIKLIGAETDWESRNHFFAIAARAMRFLLVDHARKKNAGKRGGKEEPLSIDDMYLDIPQKAAVQIIDLDMALTELEKLDKRKVSIVECRFFAGMTIEETAKALDISTATVKRGWTSARAFLYGQMNQ